MDFTVSNKDFCDRIEELLALKRIKKETMYTACGISRSTFSMWRQDKSKPTATSIIKIADFLEVSPDYLRFGKQDEKKKETALPGDLSLDEKLIISLYRQCSDEEKASIGAFLTQLRSAPVLTPEEIANKQST